ncbi:MAG: hypothetical protein WBV18_02005, partial [Methyloceanibacter sp.]|uniref:hypothetical protein n=1 Tax=Methyloceanibacter sp. TaxID=1965321 RepID=UPI003C395702
QFGRAEEVALEVGDAGFLQEFDGEGVTHPLPDGRKAETLSQLNQGLDERLVFLSCPDSR